MVRCRMISRSSEGTDGHGGRCGGAMGLGRLIAYFWVVQLGVVFIGLEFT
jgi:hypothetical protein